MRLVCIGVALVWGLAGCGSTVTSNSASTPVPATQGAAIIYDTASNFALVHFSAGVPVPDMAEENGSVVTKPTWAAFKAFEGVP